MKFFKSQINNKEIKKLNETISFPNINKPILALNNINVTAFIFLDENLINVSFEIKGTAQVECAYTLESVDFPLDFKDSVDISEDESNQDTYYVKGNLVDLNPIILDLIIGHIPTKVIKKGAKLNASGNGYRVLSEDDLKKEREKKDEYNSAFDKLKDLDL